MDNKVSFISETVQQCFLDLFEEGFKKCGYKNYNDAIHSISHYLMINSKSKMYDHVFEKYPGVTRKLVNQMIVSKFLEFNYYRAKKNIVIDINRIILLNDFIESVILAAELNIKGSLVGLSPKDSIPLISDAYLYLSHLSDTYSINAMKDGKEDALGDIIAAIYPFSRIDHALNSESNLSRKEILLGNLVEKIIDEVEKIQFNNDITPTFNYMYRQNNKMIINNNNLDDPNNIYTEIINGFSNMPLNNDDVISMIEMALSILYLKKDIDSELSLEEKDILNSINLIKDDKEKLIAFYNINRDKIIKVFINNFFDVQKEDIFKYEFGFKKKKID